MLLVLGHSVEIGNTGSSLWFYLTFFFFVFGCYFMSDVAVVNRVSSSFLKFYLGKIVYLLSTIQR